MIVVDTNVIAYCFIEGEKTDLALRVRENDREWIVPSLWRHEFLNVLATAARAGVFAIPEACSIWRNAITALAASERPVPYEEALCCAAELKISAYDAQYVTLAQTINCICVTEDTQLLRVLPKIAVSMKEFLNSRQPAG